MPVLLQVFLISSTVKENTHTMSLITIDQDNIAILKENIYVKSVSSKSISFTKEFKELFVNEYAKGKSVKEIFKENGIDPKVLGDTRIYSFLDRCRNQSKRFDGFHDRRHDNSGRPKEKELTDEEVIAKLRFQNKVLKQENDFLKRIRYIQRRSKGQK